MATVPHVISGLGLRKFQADGFLLTRVYLHVPPVLIQSAVCLTTDPLILPKRVLRTVRSNASYFNFRYRLVSLSSSTNCLRLLIRLPFPSILCVSDVF